MNVNILHFKNNVPNTIVILTVERNLQIQLITKNIALQLETLIIWILY